MAALTLSQKAQMLATPSFLERVKAAIISKSHYWNNLPTPNIGDYNLMMQKRKRYAKRVIGGEQQPDTYAFASWILQIYTEVNPDLNGDNQLSDAVITSGTYVDPPYDFQAGVSAADNDEPIIW